MSIFQKDSFKIIFRLFVLLFIASTISMAQAPGDFRTKINGEWTAISTWETFNGSTWVNSTVYPGQNTGNYSVTIKFGNTVSISNAGISTNPMGTVTINGTLALNGSNSSTSYFLNTPEVIVTKALSPPATIEFLNKSILKLPTDGILKVSTNGLSGNCNHNEEIQIGIMKFAVCNGAPGSIFTFAELMAAGGTLNAIETTPPLSCMGTPVQLFGSYSGAFGSPPTYAWQSTGPAPISFSPSASSQNPTINPSVPGPYSISLTVSTNKNAVIYSNSEKVTLVIAPTSTKINAAICQGDTYAFDGKTYNTSGTYPSDLYRSIVTGCDSTAYLNLTVIQNSNTFINDTICEGETSIYNGIPYQVEGDYTVTTSAGCNNTILSLRVKKSSYFNFNDTICQGNTYPFHGNIYNTSGTYTVHLINKAGCDSLVTLNLTVNPIPTLTNTTLTQTICSGTSTTLVLLTSDVPSTTFEWTASTNTGIAGFITNGTNTIPAQTLFNPGNSEGKVTYIITPKANGCTGTAVNYMVIVEPKPITSDIYHQ